MSLEGHVENGQIVLDPHTELPEGSRLRIEVVERVEQGPTMLERFASVIGKAKYLPPDASYQHDHYLYGTPKRP